MAKYKILKTNSEKYKTTFFYNSRFPSPSTINNSIFSNSLLLTLLWNLQQTNEQWAIVFYLAGGIYFADTLFYLIFGSGKPVSWNKVESEEDILSSISSKVEHSKSKSSTYQNQGYVKEWFIISWIIY